MTLYDYLSAIHLDSELEAECSQQNISSGFQKCHTFSRDLEMFT